LSASGDDVFLLEADSQGNLLRFADRAEFDGAPGDVTWGRSPDGLGGFDWLRSATRGGANAAVLAGYPVWAATAFPPGTSSVVTGLAADPDGDGLTNWAEFAFVTNPLMADGSMIQVIESAATDLTFTYRRRSEVSEVSCVVTVSDSLTAWSSPGAALNVISELAQPDGSTLVTARLAIGDGRRYLRVEARPVP